MDSQKRLIHKAHWDNLIILDACRYDYFKKVHGKYFSGDLKKVRSSGGETKEWLRNTFPEFYDLRYISANPYVNSYGVEFEGFNPTEHFEKIYDAWEHKWNEEKETVKPKDLVSYSIDKIKNRTIIHFMQPHVPFLSLNFDELELGLKMKDKAEENETIKNKLRKFFNQNLIKTLGETRAKGLIQFLEGNYIESKYERMIREVGAKKVLQAYEENLENVLKVLENYFDYLDGKTVITADHGEVFGKKGVWGHRPNSSLKELREVAWLEVEK